MNNTCEEKFKEQVAEGVTVVMFSAPWCGQCKMTVPVLSQIETEINGAKFLLVNVPDCEHLVDEFSVSGLPTIVILKDGKEFSRMTGMKPKTIMVNEIKKAL